MIDDWLESERVVSRTKGHLFKVKACLRRLHAARVNLSDLFIGQANLFPLLGASACFNIHWNYE